MEKGLLYEIVIYFLSIVAAIFFIVACASEYWDSRHGMDRISIKNGTSPPPLTSTVSTNSTTPTTVTNSSLSNVTNATGVSSTQPPTTIALIVLAFQSDVELKAEFTTGLWKKCTRYDDPLAETFDVDDKCDSYSNGEIDAVRALYIIGIIALFFALVALIALCCKNCKRIGTVVVVATSIATFFIALALIVYAATEKKSEADYEWGYVLAWVAVVLEIINIIVMFVSKFTLHQYKEVV